MPEVAPKEIVTGFGAGLTEETVSASSPPPTSLVSFSLSPQPISGQLGKSFMVTVAVSGGQMLSGADIALKYDAAKLQVKSLRDGGLFGPRPSFSYGSDKKGVLIVRVGHPDSAPTAAGGRLITVEFLAIGEGLSEIAFNGGQTRARAGAAQILVAVSTVPVVIGRDQALSSNEK
jgi:hypothetical protein